MFISAISCNHYYRVNKNSNNFAITDTANLYWRYIILRTGINSYFMNNIELSADKKTVSCILENLPDEHKLHLRHGRGGSMRYNAYKPESVIINEVHLYIPRDTMAIAGAKYTLALEKIKKIEVLEKDNGATTASYILGGLGITVGTILVAAVIAVALKSSCPFVSAFDGNQIGLQGEIYGGAIYPQMTRDDYMALKMAPLPNGNLQLQISNELKERQYTDIAELMVVTHNKGVQILVDEYGKLYSISKPEYPITACVENKDVLPLLKEKKDERIYSFDDTTSKLGVNNLNLKFNRPTNTTSAKLILRLKNSYWLDATYGKMTMGFGSYYNSFIKQQYTKPVSVLNQWVKEQAMPLHVELNTDNGWQNTANITTFGPLAYRETVIPLDLTNVTGNEINVRLSTGFMFWDIDYAAIDFSENEAFEVRTLLPKKATDETGKNVIQLINKADGNYLEQPVPGNAVRIEYAFKGNKTPNKMQTFILHAKGYYEHVRDYKGGINISFLEQFKKPYRLSTYSMELYKEALKGNVEQFLAAN